MLEVSLLRVFVTRNFVVVAIVYELFIRIGPILSDSKRTNRVRIKKEISRKTARMSSEWMSRRCAKSHTVPLLTTYYSYRITTAGLAVVIRAIHWRLRRLRPSNRDKPSFVYRVVCIALLRRVAFLRGLFHLRYFIGRYYCAMYFTFRAR